MLGHAIERCRNIIQVELTAKADAIQMIIVAFEALKPCDRSLLDFSIEFSAAISFSLDHMKSLASSIAICSHVSSAPVSADSSEVSLTSDLRKIGALSFFCLKLYPSTLKKFWMILKVVLSNFYYKYSNSDFL
jgi:hypothetical protein